MRISNKIILIWFLFLTAIGDTSVAVYRRFFEEGATKIGISAHIGGMMAGNLFFYMKDKRFTSNYMSLIEKAT